MRKELYRLMGIVMSVAITASSSSMAALGAMPKATGSSQTAVQETGGGNKGLQEEKSATDAPASESLKSTPANDVQEAPPQTGSSPEVVPGEFEGHKLNYQDMPGEREIESVSVHGDDYVPLTRNGGEEVPEKYDYEDFKSYMPPLKDQDPFGSCWAHSALALAEISLSKNGILTDTDLSELQLAYFYYNSVVDPLGGTAGDSNQEKNTGKNYLDKGGNLFNAQEVLASWVGAGDDNGYLSYPKLENEAPESIDPKFAYYDRAHLENYYDVNIATDKEAAKKLIMKNGALGVSYYAPSGTMAQITGEVYDDTHNAFCDLADHGGTNHAVTAVGWDDNFSREYFPAANRPDHDGAWLIRNSWSTGSYGDNQNYSGYFWMSYETKSLMNGFSFEFDRSDNYDHNYQYDGAMTSGTILGNGSITCANVFTAQGNEILKAVSFSTGNTNENYTVEVYRYQGATGIDTSEGKQAGTASGATEYEGYYTVPLDSPVSLNDGERFAVVVTLEKTGQEVSFEVEGSFDADFFTSTASAESGQSFSLKGSSWEDYGETSNRNFRIKAFTDDVTPTTVYLTDEDTVISVGPATYTGSDVIPAVMVLPDGAGQFLNVNSYSVTADNNVDAGSEASVTVTASDLSKCTGTATKDFTINPAPLSHAYRYFIDRPGSEGQYFDDDSTVLGSSWSNPYPHLYPTTELAKHIVFYFNDDLLTEGTDYEAKDVGNDVFLDAGNERVIDFEGKGNFTGVRPFRLKIAATGIAETGYYNSKFFPGTEYHLDVEMDSPITLEYNNGDPVIPAGLNLVNQTRGALTEDVDYEITEYTYNTDVGTAQVKVAGKGNYTGEKTFDYTIEAANISGEDTVLEGVETQPYNDGSPVTLPDLTVKYKGVTLDPETDYTVSYTNNTATGVNSATVTVTGKNNYTGEKSATFSISSYNITAEGYSGTYDGEPHTISVNNVPEGAVVTFAEDAEGPFGDENPDYTDAGTYTVYYRVELESVLIDADSRDVVIEPMSIAGAEVTLVNDELEYNGDYQSPEISSIEAGGLTLTDSDYELSGDTTGIRTGAYTLTVTGKGNFTGSCTADWSILQAENSFTAELEIDDWTYGDTPEDPYAEAEFGEVVYSYSDTADGTYSSVKPINAGTHYVKATVEGNEDYTSLESDPLEFTIEKREVTISGIKAEDKVYDGTTDAVLDYSEMDIDGIVGLDDLQVTATGAFEDKNAGDEKTVYINALTLSGDDAVNYVLADGVQQEDTTASISAKSVRVRALRKTKVYGATDPGLTYEVEESDLVTGDTLSVFSGELSREDGENVGSYNITVGTLTAGDNYSISFTGADFTITVKTVTEPVIELDPESFTYTGSACEPAVTVKDVDQVIPAEEYTVEFADNIDVGDAKVTITDNNGGNYTVNGEKSFRIDAANAEIVTHPAALNPTYDGTRQALVSEGTATGGEFQYRLSTETSYKSTVPTALDAGDYTVCYKVKADKNHVDTEEESIPASISPASYNGQDTASGSAKYGTEGEVELGTLLVDGGSLKADSVNVTSDVNSVLNETPVISGTKLSFAFKDDSSLKGSTASVEVGVDGGQNYEDYTLEITLTVLDKLPQTLEISGIDNGSRVEKSYGDADFSAQATLTLGNGTVSYESSATDVAEINGQGMIHIKKYGDTIITATAAETAEYAEGSIAFTLSVSKRQITVSNIIAGNKTYDKDVAATLVFDDVVLTGRVGNENIYVTAKGEFEDYNAGVNKVVTITEIELKGTDADNYELALTGQQETAAATISPIVVGLKWKNLTFEYDGDEKIPEATAEGVLSGDHCTVTVTGGKTEPGQYTAVASALTGEGSINYELPRDRSVLFTILPEHNHDGVRYSLWTGTDSLPDTEGYWYLGNDVTLASTWNVPVGAFTICLNGHSISTASVSDPVVKLETGSTLTLYDDQDKSGQISAPATAPECIQMDGGSLVLNEGKVAGGVSDRGGASNITITGGSVDEVTFNKEAANGGGSITVTGGSVNSITSNGNKNINMSGSPQIGSVILRGDSMIHITDSFTPESPIAVTIMDGDTEVHREFTEGLSGNIQTTDISEIFSCGEGYVMILDSNGEAQSVESRTITYSKNSDEATGDMSDCDGTFPKGSVITVSENKFIRDDFNFTGWNTKNDGTGTPYAPDDKLTLSDDTTLYAQWQEKSVMTVEADNVTRAYDGKLYGIEVKVTDPASGCSISYGTEDGKYTLEESPKFSAAGTHTVYFKVEHKDYKTYKASADVIINPVSIASANVLLKDKQLRYNGTVQENSVMQVTLDGVVLTEADYRVSGDLSGKDKGTYRITVTGIGNYTGEAVAEWEIVDEAAKVTGYPTASPIVYGQTLSASRLTGGRVELNGEVISGSFVWADGSIQPAVRDSNLTQYGVIFISDVVTVNLFVTITVEKADPEVTPPEGLTLSYNGFYQELVTPGEVDGGVMYYAVGVDDKTLPTDVFYSTDIPEAFETGAYYIWYRVKGDENHNDTEPDWVKAVIRNAGSCIVFVDDMGDEFDSWDTTYTGSEIKPLVRVYDEGRLLSEERDYDVTYKNNVNAYTYREIDLEFQKEKAPTVVVTMKGAYSGTEKVYFTIQRVNMSEVYGTDCSAVYNGSSQKPGLVLKYKKLTLKEDRDYSLYYFEEPDFTPVKYCKKVGVYRIVVLAKGKNYIGDKEFSFVICPPDCIAASKLKISTDRSSYKYTGGEIIPRIVVRYKGQVLKPDRDYTVDFSENVYPGTGHITISGNTMISTVSGNVLVDAPDDSRYKVVGSRTVGFTIKGTSMGSLKIYNMESVFDEKPKNYKPENFTYDGEWHTQDEDSYLVVNSRKVDGEKVEDILDEGTHFKVTYERNLNAGQARMIFTGIEEAGYTGKTTRYFRIKTHSIKAEDIYIEEYMEETLKLGGTVPVPSVSYNGSQLTEGIDFTMSYSKNKKLSLTDNWPSYTVNGRGNFGGKSRAIPFNIMMPDLGSGEIFISTPDMAWKDKKNNYKQKIQLLDASGKTLTMGDKKDYTVTYYLDSVERGNELPDKWTVSKNSLIWVVCEAAGSGRYKGVISGNYLVTGQDKVKSILKAKASINSQEHTGQAVIPEDMDFKVTYGKKDNLGWLELLDDDDPFTEDGFRVLSYYDNVRRGNGIAIIEGSGCFTGVRVVKYKIGTRKISTILGW